MMNDAQGSSNALPPFITKTYEMVDDPSTDSIVSWSQSNKSFVVWNPPEFSGELLPRYFKHNNFSSFIRQLNTYGFRKVDPEQWEFANEDFIRGQPHLLKNIHRRKPVHSHSIQNAQNQGASSMPPLTEPEKQRYKQEIDRLQYEKESMSLEFHQHQQEQEGIELAARSLTERLKIAGTHQKEMLCSLDRTLQKPALDCAFAPQISETNDRKRRLSAEAKNDQACPFNIPIRENLNADALLALNKELVEQLENSLTFWEEILKDVGESYLQQKWPLELDHEPASCADSPAICYPQLSVETVSKEGDIDMNSEPVKAATTEEEGGGGGGTAAKVQAGANDVFWEQFLTENPGGGTNNVGDMVQSERKDVDGMKNDNKGFEQYGKFWWNMRSINNLADQLGQLTPTERT